MLGALIFVQLLSYNLTYLECHALVNRTIKRFQNEKDFDKFFNRDKIDEMTVPTGKTGQLV